ncbi:Maf family protein [Fervidibacillus halotolerans]|uniref:dTTP/UTP pyrophosphatase n=1 Tax=Fervidibacillus halotolerans TaxID=2980027 RepID=A0A9E8LY67_9BACI|nr:Maf family protein [Fervidibacillus halotolerans]WAA11587.1 Maf family protein [Fervidibacillus halotolerans]
MTQLILASSSPRRKELLKLLQQPFDVIAAEVDERMDQFSSPEETVMNLARKKAKAVAKDYHNSYVIGADTIVTIGNEILGKPRNAQEAKNMLNSLSGKTHTVYTGTAILHEEQQELFVGKADVTFWELSDEEIDRYIQSGEPFDKAGGYAIQGYGALFVKKIHGDYYSVVGFPIGKVYRVLKKMGYPFKNEKN